MKRSSSSYEFTQDDHPFIHTPPMKKRKKSPITCSPCDTYAKGLTPTHRDEIELDRCEHHATFDRIINSVKANAMGRYKSLELLNGVIGNAEVSDGVRK